MQDFSFSLDWLAVLIASFFIVLCLLVWRWARTYHSPYLKFSDLHHLKNAFLAHQQSDQNYAFKLMLTALGCFLLAFVDPHYYVLKDKGEKNHLPHQDVPREGIAIYFVLDQSGSMSEKVKATIDGKSGMITKVDLLKKVTQDFIAGDPQNDLLGRPNDLLGLIFFARAAQVEVPLTLDRQEIENALKKFNNVTDENLDGTAIGYAIYKAASLIAATRYYAQDLAGEGKPAYTIKNTIIILVTDGFQDPSMLDKGNRLRNIELVEAADYARANGVKLYIINVDPAMGSAEYVLNRKLMREVAELTGGKYFLVDNDANLGKIYNEIDKLEKSEIPNKEMNLPKSQQPSLYRRISFYPFLIAIGMACLALAIMIKGIFKRSVP